MLAGLNGNGNNGNGTAQVSLEVRRILPHTLVVNETDKYGQIRALTAQNPYRRGETAHIPFTAEPTGQTDKKQRTHDDMAEKSAQAGNRRRADQGDES